MLSSSNSPNQDIEKQALLGSLKRKKPKKMIILKHF
jgi:hypothetical protein